jgi:hypothetical protein
MPQGGQATQPMQGSPVQAGQGYGGYNGQNPFGGSGQAARFGGQAPMQTNPGGQFVPPPANPWSGGASIQQIMQQQAAKKAADAEKAAAARSAPQPGSTPGGMAYQPYSNSLTNFDGGA